MKKKSNDLNFFYKQDFSNINWFVFATKLGSGALKNGRDSNPKYRRVICFHGDKVKAGSILVTQCGARYFYGENCYFSRNFSIMTKIDGIVYHTKKKIGKKIKTIIGCRKK